MRHRYSNRSGQFTSWSKWLAQSMVLWLLVTQVLFGCSSTTRSAFTPTNNIQTKQRTPGTRPAIPAKKGGAGTESGRPTGREQAATKEQMIQEVRRRKSTLSGSAPGAGTVAAAASQHGLSHAGSEAELSAALAQTPTPKPARTLDGLASFNVLIRALVDPQTGEVVLHGQTDPRYPTGPLPYRAWLADALQNPAPVFSLDPISGTSVPSQLDADLTRLSRDDDFGLQWLKRLIDPVLFRQPSLGQFERRLLDAKLQRNLNITPQEHEAYAQWIRDGKKNFASVPQYYLARSFMSKLLMGVGAPRGVGACIMAVFRAQQDPTPETGADMFVQIGNLTEFYDIRRRRQAGEISSERAGALMVAAYGEGVLSGLGMPAGQAKAMTDAIRNGGPEDAVLAEINKRWETKVREALLAKLIHGFSFSAAFLAQTYRLPPVMSRANLNGARADSVLMRTFFAADESLKYLATAAPESQTPGFQQYLLDTTAGQALQLPKTGNIRYWLEPSRVELQPLPQAGGVRFGEARLRIGTESLNASGADAAGSAAYNQALSRYSAMLTADYDKHAAALPALHAAREAAKIIALARWLRDSGVRADVAVQAASKPIPSEVEGFWGLTYLVQPTGQNDTIVYWAQGGVTFADQDGQPWLAQRQAPDADNDTIRQLAASTALAEQAATAAGTGDLESARALAEQSAQAMTGQLDMSRLPAVSVPEPVPTDAGVPGAVQAGIPAVALQVVDQEVAAQAGVQATLQAAAAQKEADPAAWAQAEAAAQQATARSQARLTRLQQLLAAYRQQPVQGRQLWVDLTQLAMPEQKTTAQPPVAQPPVEQPQTAAEAPTVAAEIDGGCEELGRELVALRTELQRATDSLRRLNRSIQSDAAQLAEWGKEADDAAKRANKRVFDVSRNLLTEKGLKIAERYCKTTGPAAAECERQVQILGTLSDTTKLTEWGMTRDTSWTYVLTGAKEALDRLLPDGKPKKFVYMMEQLINSTYDITAWYMSYQAIRQLEANSESFLQAVHSSAGRIHLIVERIRQIEATPLCGKSPSVAPASAPPPPPVAPPAPATP